MSSLATSSPVSASTLAYLMRWPVVRLSWLNETFSDSDVAGYRATGHDEGKAQKAFPVGAGGHAGELQIVLALEVEAKFGIRSAMPSVTAKRQCPDLIFG